MGNLTNKVNPEAAYQQFIEQIGTQFSISRDSDGSFHYGDIDMMHIPVSPTLLASLVTEMQYITSKTQRKDIAWESKHESEQKNDADFLEKFLSFRDGVIRHFMTIFPEEKRGELEDFFMNK